MTKGVGVESGLAVEPIALNPALRVELDAAKEAVWNVAPSPSLPAKPRPPRITSDDPVKNPT